MTAHCSTIECYKCYPKLSTAPDLNQEWSNEGTARVTQSGCCSWLVAAVETLNTNNRICTDELKQINPLRALGLALAPWGIVNSFTT